MQKPLIKIKNGNVSFDNKILMDKINHEIKRGDFHVITGLNGSGKSVFLKILAGKSVLTSGELIRTYKNKEIIRNSNNETQLYNNIGYLAVRHSFKDRQNQNSFFYQQRYNNSFSGESLTTIEYLYNAQKNSSENRDWDIKKAVEILDLEHLLHKSLIKLSNGESRRVRIAEALIKNPLILFLDQPLTGVDVKNREKFKDVFQAITDSGITLIIACNQDEVPENADSVTKLSIGKSPTTTDYKNFVPSSDIAPHSLSDENISFLKNLPEYEKYDFIVKMNSVNINYGDKSILRDINWQIKQGERWSLYGPNGAGKSSLLSLITGDNPQAYSNDITLFDIKRGSGESIWDIKRKIGFVSPELFQFFPQHFTCKEAISTGFSDFLIKPKNITEHQNNIINEWMEILKISDYKDETLRRLPITIQRLTLLARALVKNPPLLILDEPCQGFDNQQQNHFRNIIDTISDFKNITWIYVTHNIEQLPESTTNYLTLTSDGEIEKIV